VEYVAMPIPHFVAHVDYTGILYKSESILKVVYINPLKTKRKLPYFKDPVLTAQETIFISVIKTHQFMLHRAKSIVFSEINTKHINTVWAECTVVEC
jgi:hypothetical protein